MFERFFPNEYVDSIHFINFKALLKMNIDSLIIDIDNTLVPHYVKTPPKSIRDLILKLNKMGFKVCLLSNNNEQRVNLFNESLNVKCVYKARKPSMKGINKAIKLLETDKNSACIIGDQVFTDVWCGNRAGIYTILLKPIVNKDEFTVRLKRGIEKIIINLYLKSKNKDIK